MCLPAPWSNRHGFCPHYLFVGLKPKIWFSFTRTLLTQVVHLDGLFRFLKQRLFFCIDFSRRTHWWLVTVQYWSCQDASTSFLYYRRLFLTFFLFPWSYCTFLLLKHQNGGRIWNRLCHPLLGSNRPGCLSFLGSHQSGKAFPSQPFPLLLLIVHKL